MNLENKNVLVTGGAGFVGGHLVEELIKLQSNVIVVDINLDKRSYLFTENLQKKSGKESLWQKKCRSKDLRAQKYLRMQK